MFKDKTSKKRINNTNDKLKETCTLDTMHHNIIESFENKLDKYNKYKIDLVNLNNSKTNIIQNISNLSLDKNNLETDRYNELWNSNIDISEKILDLNIKIKEIENYSEIDYYKNTSEILFNYYDMIEKEATYNTKTKKTVLDALNNKNNSNQNIANTDKSSLVDEYLSLTNKQYIKKK
jgi:hypothetical protein